MELAGYKKYTQDALMDSIKRMDQRHNEKKDGLEVKDVCSDRICCLPKNITILNLDF